MSELLNTTRPTYWARLQLIESTPILRSLEPSIMIITVHDGNVGKKRPAMVF